MKPDSESSETMLSYMFQGKIPTEYISKVEVLDGGHWKNYDWKKQVSGAEDSDMQTIYFVLDDIKDLDGTSS